jgi:hypothetical protein
MDEHCFPDAELELVRKIHDEHEIQAKAELRQFAWKYILERKIMRWIVKKRTVTYYCRNKRIHLHLLSTTQCFSYMTSRAAATRLRWLKSSTRASISRCVMPRCFHDLVVLSTEDIGSDQVSVYWSWGFYSILGSQYSGI